MLVKFSSLLNFQPIISNERYLIGEHKFMLPHNKILPGTSSNLLQIFQMNGQAGRFGLVKPGKPSKVTTMCLVLGSIEKNIQGRNIVQAF